MRRTAGWLLVGLGIATALALIEACTATVNTDGLESAGVDVGAADASAPSDATVPGDSAASESDATLDATATTDAASSDAANVDDASHEDAAIDAGAPDAAFACAADASAYTLCADFDEDTLAFDYSKDSYQWSTFLLGDAGIGLDTTDRTSPPASLHVAVAASSVATGASFRLSLPTATTSIHLELDVKPDFAAIDAGSLALVNLFEINTARNYYGVAFSVGTGGYFVSASEILPGDAGGSNSSHLVPRLKQGVWTHVTLIDTRADPGHITMLMDGQTVLDEAVNTLTAGNPELRFDLGLEASGATSAASLHMDNVVLITQP